MTLAADIENALRQHLPADHHGAAQVLAQALAGLAVGVVSPAETKARLAASDLASTLRALAGCEVVAGGFRLSFGVDSQIGDVSIGDVAGGSAGVVQYINISGQATVGPIIGVQNNYYTTPSPAERERALRAIVRPHADLMGDKLTRFVGRAAECAEIEQQIADLAATGGYLILQGHAGQGKSSIIAALVAQRLLAQRGQAPPPRWTHREVAALEQPQDSPHHLAYHFIPYEPGREYQVNLLRDLNARLTLTYNLDDYYATSTSLPALKDYFAAILREVHGRGATEVIFIDGLDQIAPDSDGRRDLSFLPKALPPGVVIVIGTRPDDTLLELEAKTPRVPYELPDLSRDDFVTLLTRNGVSLERALLDRFYAAMQQNALYLDLAARELIESPHLTPETLLARVADNPENLFTFAIERLSSGGSQTRWERYTQPVLGYLLAAREPLSASALHALIGGSARELRRSLLRLGGLLGQTGDHRFFLYHLKLRDYLREDRERPGKDFVFTAADEKGYHQRLVGWCEGGTGEISAIWKDASDALEQERRAYARQHYIAHMAAACSYDRLWEVIDAGEYGREKRRHDPSTRSYVLDLDIARQAVIDEAAGDMGAQARGLPRLWHYSLLRCSLTSQADNYPEELFLALVALGRIGEAVNIIEVLSDPRKKTDTLRVIGVTLLERGSDEGLRLLQRARTTADAIPNKGSRTWALGSLAVAFAETHRWDDARATADSISEKVTHAWALGSLATALAQANRWDDALAIAIRENDTRVQTLASFAAALAQAHRWDDARATADAIPENDTRARALASLAAALAQAHRWEEAAVTFTLARATADTISKKDTRAQALASPAAALAQAHPWDDARTTADVIPENDTRAQALVSLVAALAQAHRWDNACATADAIPRKDRRVQALASLAVALAQAHRWDEATVTFALARTTADCISEKDRRAQALAFLVTALAQAHCWNDARGTADAIPEKDTRVQALASLAAALAQAHRWEEAAVTFILARSIADAIPENGIPAQMLAFLSTAFAQAHRWDDARTTADAISEEETRAWVLRTLATNLAQAHRWNDARATADSIPKKDIRVQTLGSLAAALAQANRKDEAAATFTLARATADAIPNKLPRTQALASLATSFARADCWDEAAATFTLARTTADTIAEKETYAQALHTLATNLAQAQGWDDARTTADAIGDRDMHAWALRTLAITLAQAHRWNDARTTADAIPDEVPRVQALGSLAAALAQTNHSDEAAATFSLARTTADAIRDELPRAWALSSLAAALANAHRWDAARATADAILNQKSRVEAFAAITTALAQAGHLAQAVALLADLWLHSQTRDELLSLFVVPPELLRTYPELGKEFLDSFAWVDAQLAVG